MENEDVDRDGPVTGQAVKVTLPQLRTLSLMDSAAGGGLYVGDVPCSGGMAHAWRVANSLVSKGLAALGGNRLHITEAGRRAVALAGKRRHAGRETNA